MDWAWAHPSEDAGVSGVDQFVWFARTYGYDTFLKVPCRARHVGVASIEFGQYSHATWLAPLSSGQTSYLPSRFTAQKYLIQDLLLVDRQHAGLAARLAALAARDCVEGTSFELYDDPTQEVMGLHSDGLWSKPQVRKFARTKGRSEGTSATSRKSEELLRM